MAAALEIVSLARREATLFGSKVDTVQNASNVLRAAASRFAIDLRPASEVDLASSVISADAWSFLTGCSAVRPIVSSHCASSVLYAILKRSAGCGNASVTETCFTSSFNYPETMLMLAEGYKSWAFSVLSYKDAVSSLKTASFDLLAAGEEGKFAAFSSILTSSVETLEMNS